MIGLSSRPAYFANTRFLQHFVLHGVRGRYDRVSRGIAPRLAVRQIFHSCNVPGDLRLKMAEAGITTIDFLSNLGGQRRRSSIRSKFC